jgi:glycine/D-amino acid oxidase-like deaminating enzyme
MLPTGAFMASSGAAADITVRRWTAIVTNEAYYHARAVVVAAAAATTMISLFRIRLAAASLRPQTGFL